MEIVTSQSDFLEAYTNGPVLAECDLAFDNITFPYDVHVEGDIHGSIACKDLSVVGHVSGSVRGQRIICDHLSGWINAQTIEARAIEAMTIRSSGHVYADSVVCDKLIAGGCISVNKTMFARYSITAGAYLAADSIECPGRVEAGSFIQAQHIDCGPLVASGSIESDIIRADYVHSMQYCIKYKELHTTILPYWRGFYLAMPPLKKYAAVIETKCWEEIRKVLQPDAEEICAWEGWHPLLRVQLEMFLKGDNNV